MPVMAGWFKMRFEINKQKRALIIADNEYNHVGSIYGTNVVLYNSNLFPMPQIQIMEGKIITGIFLIHEYDSVSGW